MEHSKRVKYRMEVNPNYTYRVSVKFCTLKFTNMAAVQGSELLSHKLIA